MWDLDAQPTLIIPEAFSELEDGEIETTTQQSSSPEKETGPSHEGLKGKTGIHSSTLDDEGKLSPPLSSDIDAPTMAKDGHEPSRAKETMGPERAHELFDQGRNAYLYGSYADAVRVLTPLVRPDVLISDPEELALSYEYLGLAHFYLGQLDQAESFFTDLIYFRPDDRLDPVQVPPKAVSLYNQLRLRLQNEIKERQRALLRQEELEEERRRKKMRQQVILERQVNQRLVALLPFGIGQFQNRDKSLGYFFMASEIIALGLSAGFFWSIEGLRQSDGRFAREDFSVAQRLQKAQIISGGVTIGLALSGIIHALWRFKDHHDLGNYLDPDGVDQDEQ